MKLRFFPLFIVALLGLGVARSSVSEAFVSPPTCSHGSMLYDTTSPGQSHSNLIQWTPDGSGILFDSGMAIYRTDVDGTELDRVVDGMAPISWSHFPLPGARLTMDISPDGTRIAYATCRYPTNRSFFFEVATSNLDGTEPRRLTPPKFEIKLNHFPVWSPDGTRIAYIRDRNSSDIQLFTMAADGSDKTAVTPRDDMRVGFFPPEWSPDGSRLAFVVEEGYRYGRAVYTVEHNGSDPVRLSKTLSGPTWSPDGRWIAFVSGHFEGTALYTVAADGSEEARAVTILPDGSDTWPPVWSPDGSRVLVDCLTVCVVDVESGAIVTQSPFRLHGGSVGAWSPDGSTIAVLMLQQLPYRNGSVVLYTMASDGTDQRVLIRGGLSLVAENSGWEDVPAGITSCSEGFVVPSPERNPGLVSDCKTLVGIRDTLVGVTEWNPWHDRGRRSFDETGSVVLNWGRGTPIDQWTGIEIEKACGPTYIPRSEGCEPLPTDFPELRQGPFGFVPPIPTLRPPAFRRVAAVDFSRPRVVDDFLVRYVLKGVIPPEIGHLDSLRTLNLSGIAHTSNGLSGVIPSELGRLRRLRELDLSGNDLSGNIPVELVRLSDLEVLDLGGNDLEGAIPSELGGMGNLRQLDLRSNQLSGSVPGSLGRLTELTELRLSRNQLTGEIPSELGDLGRLQRLFLDRNLITGLTPELAGITGLEQLEISENILSCLPAELIYKRGLKVDERHEPCPADSYHFRVSELAGVGHTVGVVQDADAASYSIVSGNEGGTFAMDETFGLITVASTLDADTAPTHTLEVDRKGQDGTKTLVTVTISVLSWLAPCSTGAAVPDPEGSPGLVSDCANLLVGKRAISSSDFYLGWSANTPITSWRGVTVGGSPPRVQGLNLTLKGLGLVSDYIPNSLTGRIPAEFGGLTELRTLDISWQDLTGRIPPELGNLTKLERIYLNGNEFTGCIPSKLRDIESKDLGGTGLLYCEQ